LECEGRGGGDRHETGDRGVYDQRGDSVVFGRGAVSVIGSSQNNQRTATRKLENEKDEVALKR